MVSSRAITATVIALAITATLLVPLNDVVTGKTGTVSTSENVTAVDGEYVDLQGYEIQQGTLNATDSDGNTIDSANYSVDYDTGRIKFNTSASTVISDGDTATVSYDYQATDSSTTTIAALVPLLAVLFMLVVIADKLREGM